MKYRVLLIVALSGLLPGIAAAQQTSRTQPIDGLRENRVRFHVLTGARVVVAPGQSLDNATVVIRDGIIQQAHGRRVTVSHHVHDAERTRSRGVQLQTDRVHLRLDKASPLLSCRAHDRTGQLLGCLDFLHAVLATFLV